MARTVAVLRPLLWYMETSPKNSPSSIVPICVPFTITLIFPLLMKNISVPNSPSMTTVSEGGYASNFMRTRMDRRNTSLRPWNINTALDRRIESSDKPLMVTLLLQHKFWVSRIPNVFHIRYAPLSLLTLYYRTWIKNSSLLREVQVCTVSSRVGFLQNFPMKSFLRSDTCC